MTQRDKLLLLCGLAIIGAVALWLGWTFWDALFGSPHHHLVG